MSSVMPPPSSLSARISSHLLPFFLIGGLLYAAFNFELKPVGASVSERALAARDRMYGIAFADNARTLVMVGYGGKILRSSDAGASWELAQSGTRAHLQDVEALDGERLIAGGNEGLLLYSADSGKTWQKARVLDASGPLVKVMNVARNPYDGSAWAVAHDGAVLVSRDRGESWQRLTEKQDVIWSDIDFSSAKDAVVVGEYGKMMRTQDGGSSWMAVENPERKTLNAIAFADASHGVAVGTEGTVLKTSDGGATWVKEEPVVSEHLYGVFARGSGWVAAGNKGVLLQGGFGTAKSVSLAAPSLGLAWHTRVIPKDGSLYLAGATSGVLKDKEFTPFK